MVRATTLINHSGSSSTSEVGLNFPPHRSAVAHGLSRLVAPTGTKGLCFSPFGMLKNTFGTGWWPQPVPMPPFRNGW